MIKYLILLAMLSCCAKPTKKPTPIDLGAKLSQLESKANFYTNNLPRFQDDHGFIFTEECDSLLFTALVSAALGDEKSRINIEAAQNWRTKWWHRRPGQDCSPLNGNSRSTISRDMILGLFWDFWRNKRVDLAIDLMDRLKANNYKLKGLGTLGELMMNSSMMSTLAHIILKLDGPRYEVELAFPTPISDHGGFIAHLATWHILLRGELLGHLPADHLATLKHHYQRSPKNPLFAAAYHKWTTGDQTETINLLMDESHWPSDKLPSTNNHCDEWPIQRDYKPKDWDPCPPHIHFEEWPGMELVTIYHLIVK